MLLSEPATMGDLKQAATHNGIQLNVCLSAQDAAIGYFTLTGQ